MIIKPKFRSFFCTAAHPHGCYQSVLQQVEYIKAQGHFDGPKRVLIIGASTGYGLASRIAASFGAGAKTIGVAFEKPAAGKRTASAGWYNTVAFEKLAAAAGYYAKSIDGDAFSNAIKEQVAELIKKDLGKVDLVIYSLAAPRRTDPNTGVIYSSVLKPIGAPYTNKTVDTISGTVKDITIEPANNEEIENTITVMGGDDWEMWMDFLASKDLLTEDVTTVAYSYVGPALTHPIYKNGTIGKAKDHLLETAKKLDNKFPNGRAFISINKALVTQASAAIPIVPLYISILFKIMKEKGIHEGCIEQISRLFKGNLYSNAPALDDAGRVRLDDLEMRPDVQAAIMEIWPQVTSENLEALTDIKGYREAFYHLFGFGMDNIDYNADVDVDLSIPSIAVE